MKKNNYFFKPDFFLKLKIKNQNCIKDQCLKLKSKVYVMNQLPIDVVLMGPRTSKCIISKGVVVSLPLPCETPPYVVTLNAHSQTNKDVGRRILPRFMSLAML